MRLASNRLFHGLLILSTLIHVGLWASLFLSAEAKEETPELTDRDISFLMAQLRPESDPAPPVDEPVTPPPAPIPQPMTSSNAEKGVGKSDSPLGTKLPEIGPGSPFGAKTAQKPAPMESNPFPSSSEDVWAERMREAESEQEARIAQMSRNEQIRFRNWVGEVRRAIIREYFVPPKPKYHKAKGRVLYRVEVNRDGTIRRMECLERCHWPELNLAARVMIERGAPFSSLEGIVDLPMFPLIIPVIFDPSWY